MPDVVVVGGGLTGLAAAWELERLGVDYTLVEVKPRLGGSIITERIAGFVLDGGPFVLEKYGTWDFLDELGLPDALESVGIYRDGELVIFRDGTETLVDALARRLSRPPMLRMAVSSVGRIDASHYGVCLENGLMLEARGVVVAAPARYAERILRSFDPDVADYLFDYRYEPVARVSLGLRAADLTHELIRPEGSLFRFLECYDFPSRVPPDHVLIRAGVRLNVDPDVAAPQAAIGAVQALLPGVEPLVTQATYWREDFPLTRALPEHGAALDAIDALLPPTVRLVGSDYRARKLDQQVEQGRAAACAVWEQLAR